VTHPQKQQEQDNGTHTHTVKPGTSDGRRGGWKESVIQQRGGTKRKETKTITFIDYIQWQGFTVARFTVY